MGLIEKLSCWVRGFGPDKYFKFRENFYKTKFSIVKKYYKFRVLRIEKSMGYIGLFDEENRNVFENRPILFHGIQGIFISEDVKIGKMRE